LEATSSEFIKNSKHEAIKVIDEVNSYPLANLNAIFTDEFFERLHSNPIQTLEGTVDKTKLTRLIRRHRWNTVDEDKVSVRILTIHASKGNAGGHCIFVR
jgi:hypothetical protein